MFALEERIVASRVWEMLWELVSEMREEMLDVLWSCACGAMVDAGNNVLQLVLVMCPGE